ncbi:MAG TPA: ribulose-phosphate 3-epimerase [Coxiellaceae bacterium]|nr:ribulose-phosphate 3-epimerase [Coxiellaceae bacterium]
MTRKEIFISASILSANFARLGEEARTVLKAGANGIHFDVMDHHFVPNLSFGAVVCEGLHKDGVKAPIDVHLMVDNPDLYVEPFAKAGANVITFHPETSRDVMETIHHIERCNMKAGLAFNPEKPLDMDVSVLKKLQMILVMSVHPGFGGQRFMRESLEKIKRARELVNKHNTLCYVAIDGGINKENCAEVQKAGADFLVMGSAIFHSSDYGETLHTIRAQL